MSSKVEPEEWLPVEGHEGFEVSSYGNLRGPKGTIKGTVLPTGYTQVSIQMQRYAVHRLVCSTFNGKPATGEHALHKDHNKLNNHKDNLYWGSHQDNMHDMVQAGRSSKHKAPAAAKLTEDVVRDIRVRLEQGESYKMLMREFGIQHNTMYNIRHYKSWQWVKPRRNSDNEPAGIVD